MKIAAILALAGIHGMWIYLLLALADSIPTP
jgi:hypothetical protein